MELNNLEEHPDSHLESVTGTSYSVSWQEAFYKYPKNFRFIKKFDDFKTIDWIRESKSENEKQFDEFYRTNRSNVNNRNNNYRVASSDISEFSIDDEQDTSTNLNTLQPEKFPIVTRFVNGFLRSFQSWLVLTLMGITIGLIAGMLNILAAWLGSLKDGYCSNGFYLNRDFCCMGEKEDSCSNWHPWSEFFLLKYIYFIIFSTLFGCTAAFLCKRYAKTAAGSGISEVKCIVSGFDFDGFLGWWTLLIKSIGLPLTIASGLSVGKEGPSVHYAACVGNCIPKLFKRFEKSPIYNSQFLTAASAAGVAVAFASPVGGVLFSIEEISSNFQLLTMWKSYFCSLVAVATLKAMNPFRTGQIVLFQVKYDSDWNLYEIPFFIILGLFGGVYGIIVAKYNIKAVAFRQKYLSNYPITEVMYLCIFTAIISYTNEFLRLDMTESMQILFHECGGDFDHGLCSKETSDKIIFIINLLVTTIIRMFLVIISYNCKVPCGIFVPSMAAGATFGRVVGIIVEMISPNNCTEGNVCIISGTYAFLGAAAALSGITHLTVAVVVIMFELTGAAKYIIPTMIVLGVTKMINDKWGHGGIADQMIVFNGLPFIDPKEEHDFHRSTVSHAMTDSLVCLPSRGLTLKEISDLLEKTKFKCFPIIISNENHVLLGYIERKDLEILTASVRITENFERDLNKEVVLISPKCLRNLTTSPSEIQAQAKTFDLNDEDNDIFLSADVDMGSAIILEDKVVYDFLKVDIGTTLENVLTSFHKLGQKFVYVEDNGLLVGVLSRKDILKYEIYLHKVTNKEYERSYDEGLTNDISRDEKIWNFLCFVGEKSKELRSKILLRLGFQKYLRMGTADMNDISSASSRL